MIKQNRQQVRSLKPSDIERILQIQQEQNILTKDADTASREGFLVYLMGREEVEGFITNGNKFMRVYDEGHGVEGYIAAYTKQFWLEQGKEELTPHVEPEYKSILQGDYIYLRHIAKKKGVSGRVAIAIENTFYEELSQKGYNHVIGEIAIKTPLGVSNKASMNFHTKLGFYKIGEREDNSGFTWAVMCKDLQDKGGAT